MKIMRPKGPDDIPSYKSVPKSAGVSSYMVAWLLDLQAMRQYDVALDIVQVIKKHYMAGETSEYMDEYERKLRAYAAEQAAIDAALAFSKGGDS